jgi:hypothetical protein
MDGADRARSWREASTPVIAHRHIARKKKPADLSIAGLNPIQKELEETGEL